VKNTFLKGVTKLFFPADYLQNEICLWTDQVFCV